MLMVLNSLAQNYEKYLKKSKTFSLTLKTQKNFSWFVLGFSLLIVLIALN